MRGPVVIVVVGVLVLAIVFAALYALGLQHDSSAKACSTYNSWMLDDSNMGLLTQAVSEAKEAGKGELYQDLLTLRADVQRHGIDSPEAQLDEGPVRGQC